MSCLLPLTHARSGQLALVHRVVTPIRAARARAYRTPTLPQRAQAGVALRPQLALQFRTRGSLRGYFHTSPRVVVDSHVLIVVHPVLQGGTPQARSGNAADEEETERFGQLPQIAVKLNQQGAPREMVEHCCEHGARKPLHGTVLRPRSGPRLARLNTPSEEVHHRAERATAVLSPALADRLGAESGDHMPFVGRKLVSRHQKYFAHVLKFA